MPVQRTYAEEIEKLSNKQNCGHHNFFLKHGLDIISVLQKCLWLNGLNRALKIIFSKLGNCALILAIFFK